MLNGSALVLLRIANASVERDDVASPDISGDGSAIGWTPTASTTPTKTSRAAYLRWLQRVERDTCEAARQQGETDGDDAA